MNTTEVVPSPRATRPQSAWRPLALTANEKIDICRGLFAVLVVMDHALQFTWETNPGARERLPGLVQDTLRSVVNSGTIAVMGFFVISGYCIQLSVGRLSREGRFPLKTYLIARASRILPLYYVALLTAIIVEHLIASARPAFWPRGLNEGVIVAQLFVVQNLYQMYGSFAASWSITNEAFYYVLYGCLATFAASRRFRPAWLGMALCVIVLGVTQALYITVARTPLVYSIGQLLGLGMIWFLGVFVAIHGSELVRSPAMRAAAKLWPAVLAAAPAWRFFHLSPHGVYLIPGIAFGLMLLRFLDVERQARADAPDPKDVARTWRSSLITMCGLASYPMYLFHGPIMMLVGSLALRLGLAPAWPVTWLLHVVIGVTSGIVLGVILERPLMEWRAGMLRRVKPDRHVASAPRPKAILSGGPSYSKRML